MQITLETIDINKLEPYISGEISEAPGCGIASLDRYLRFKYNYTIIAGAAATGKTIGMLRIFYEWANRLEKKTLLFCNENPPAELCLFLVEQKLGKYINHAERSEIQEALEWVNEYFQFLPQDYNTNLRSVLELSWRVKINLFNFDCLFIDPYNSITAQFNYRDHYQGAGVMRDYVKEGQALTTPIKLCVSMHVMSEAQRTRDKEGHIKCPHVSQLEMGSMHFNRCDDAIVIHRQTQSETRRYITELHVQKIKHSRTGGECTPIDKPVELKFIKQTGGFEWSTTTEKEAGF